MPNFKTCPNGHNYDADLYSKCPYCPTENANADLQQTLVDFKRTQIFEEGQNQLAKTVVDEDAAGFGKTPTWGGAEQHPFKRTTIAGRDGAANTPLEQAIKRKLVGWLATFSNDEYGEDYRLYVGKNKIGSGKGCDILINDSSVSGEHATILFRENEFLLKDNFSTNGTRVNGETMDEGKLKEGDEIRVGNTVFKMKTVF